MIIYIDESKRLWKWEIVVWWFISNHNTTFIEKFLKNKKKDFDIIEKIELKSTNKFWKVFIEKLSIDKDFKNLDITTFGFYFDNYFLESEWWYINILLKLFLNIFDKNRFIWKKATIVHDNINISNNKSFEVKVNDILRKKYKIKPEFKIKNSKKNLSLQLADLIVWEYKKLYFFRDVKILSDFIHKKDLYNKKT